MNITKSVANTAAGDASAAVDFGNLASLSKDTKLI